MVNSSEKSSMKDLIKVHQFREMFYLFLSRSFSREAEKTFLQSLFEVSTSLHESLKDVEESSLSQGRELLLENFCKEIRGVDEEIVLGDLARHYAFLFLGVGSENIALCESAYRSERGLLFQDSYFDIVQKYDEVGLMKRQDLPEPEDHLSVELAYMANLCRLTIVSIENKMNEDIERYYTYQETFLHDHLVPWVPSFSESLLEASPSTFYTAVAYLLKGFIRLDAELIHSLLSEVVASGNSSKKPEAQSSTGIASG